MYIEQVEQLVVLQNVDTEIIGLQKILEDAPRKLQTLQENQEYLSRQQGVIQEKIDVLLEQKKRIDEEIENDAQKIKKSKNKLMLVENTKEYHAMMREMDTLEKTNRMREDDRNNLLADLTDLEARQEALQNDINTVTKSITSQQSTLDEELADVRQRVDKLTKDKKRASAAVPAPILSRYNFIRERISNPVIVPVSETPEQEGVCKGCNIIIPPQIYIDLQKGEQILSCPNCLRIIYWEKHFAVEE